MSELRIALPQPTRPFAEEVGASPGRLKIAFTSEPFLAADVHENCVKGLESTVGLCEQLGHDVTEASPRVDGRAFADAFLTLLCAETRLEIEEAEATLGKKATHRYFEPETWALSLLGKHVAALDFSRAVHFLHRSSRHMGSFFEDYDVLLTPTLSSPPLPTGTLQPNAAELVAMKLLDSLNASAVMNALADVRTIADRVFRFMPYTPIFNATGQPAMSVPLYWNEQGLPIGMQFVGRYGDDATLFRLAAQLEEARPWVGRVPPVAAHGAA